MIDDDNDGDWWWRKQFMGTEDMVMFDGNGGWISTWTHSPVSKPSKTGDTRNSLLDTTENLCTLWVLICTIILTYTRVLLIYTVSYSYESFGRLVIFVPNIATAGTVEHSCSTAHCLEGSRKHTHITCCMLAVAAGYSPPHRTPLFGYCCTCWMFNWLTFDIRYSMFDMKRGADWRTRKTLSLPTERLHNISITF